MAHGSDGSWQFAVIGALSRFANGVAVRPCPQSLDGTAITQMERLKIDGLVDHGAGRTPMQRIYDRAWQVQRNAAIELARTDVLGRLAPLIFKGADYIERYFAGKAPSLVGDIDVLVERSGIGEARAAMFRLGYRQAKFDAKLGGLADADIATIAAVEGAHYELFPFCRLESIEIDDDERAELERRGCQAPLYILPDGRVLLNVEVDIHHNVALDIDVEPMLQRARRGPFDGTRAFTSADALWFTTSRLYTETALHGKTTLRDFAYLIALLRSEEIDWDSVLATCELYQLRPALYYYLSFIDQLFQANRVPSFVLKALNPRYGSRVRDWGWQLGRIFEEVDVSPAWLDVRACVRVRP